MSLLVDTSVWSLAFRRDGHPGLPEVGALRAALLGAEIRNTCRRRGVQIGTIDALLIQLSQRYDLTLLTTDKDFHAAAQHVDVHLWTMG